MRCQHCKGTKNLYYIGTSSSGLLRYLCRSCNTERIRVYRKTPKGKEAIKRAVLKYETTHPERRSAWNKASILALKRCEVCGDSKSHRHHPDITKPLAIQFLCPKHHKQAHMLE